jgi:hypothetical protein
MNDEFLTQFREPPRPAFAHALYERISQKKVSLRAQLAGRLTLRNALAGLFALILVAACVYVLAAPKWVEVDKHLWVQERSSGNNIYISQIPPFSFYTSPLSSIEEAKSQAGFEFKVTTWVPPGFDLKGASAPDMWSSEWSSEFPQVNVFWERGGIPPIPGERGGIPPTPEELAFQAFYTRQLILDKYYPASFGMVVGRGSTKMTKVNSIPAILIRGDWDYNKVFRTFPSVDNGYDWDKKAALQLIWREGEIVYRIYAIDSSASVDDLICMAESAR